MKMYEKVDQFTEGTQEINQQRETGYTTKLKLSFGTRKVSFMGGSL
jgi:hypothetical protein